MRGIAEEGRGDYFYIETHRIEEIVAHGFRGLTSLMGMDTTLRLRGINGSVIKKVYNKEDKLGIKLSDLRYGDKKVILIELQVDPPSSLFDTDTSIPSGQSNSILFDCLQYEISFQSVACSERSGLQGIFSIGVVKDYGETNQTENPSVLIALAIAESAEADKKVLESLTSGKFTEAKEAKAESYKRLQSSESLEEDPKGMLHYTIRKAKESLDSMKEYSSPSSGASRSVSLDSLTKFISYNQHASSNQDQYMCL